MNEQQPRTVKKFHAGTDTRAYEWLGCHPMEKEGQAGYVFRVWAPNAEAVHVVGDFNRWDIHAMPMKRSARGVWKCWTPAAREGSAYKYHIRHYDGTAVYKADPMAQRTCRQPDTASVIWTKPDFVWHDRGWFASRARKEALKQPMNIYELHLGSWRRREDGGVYSYTEIAHQIAGYVRNMGYTHVELMPLTEYPHDGSWGYQVTGWFAPTSRYGSPREFMEFVDILHQAGIGVILDWVPAHFCKDEHGLADFDGTSLYEPSDPIMRDHPTWGTRVFDYSKPEVRSFLISSAVYWLKEFHIDGLRVDAVSSMLYLDFNRTRFTPNRFGGRENLEAIEFLRQLNHACFAVRKSVVMIAEESTAWPNVTLPDFVGGLGFLFKWNMGWTHDTLQYMLLEPPQRRENHGKLTFSMTYAFQDNHVLPLSHDEVVGGKCSLINKMPGEYPWKFANLRLLLGYQMAHPGKKLTFMGAEFGQFTEWNAHQRLDWLLLEFESHRQLQAYTRALNHFYLANEALWADDADWGGFQWIQPDDGDNSVLAFRRMAPGGRELICILNFSPEVRENYRLGLPRPGRYECAFSSDEALYGGFGTVLPCVRAEEVPFREYQHSGVFRIAPMSAAFYARCADSPEKAAI